MAPWVISQLLLCCSSHPADDLPWNAAWIVLLLCSLTCMGPISTLTRTVSYSSGAKHVLIVYPHPSPIAPLIHTPSAGPVLWLLVMQIPALLIVWPPHPSPLSRAHLSSVPTLNPSCRTLRVTALHARIPVVLMCVPLTLSMCSLGCVYPSRCVIWLRLGGLFVFLCPREVPMAGDESTLLPGFRACAARQASPLWLVMGWKQPCVSVGSAFICKLAELGGWRRGWEWMKRSDYKSLNQSKFFL